MADPVKGPKSGAPTASPAVNPTPDPAAGTLPELSRTDLLRNAEQSLTRYRDYAPGWALDDGVKLFTGYINYLLDHPGPESTKQICSLMKAPNLEQALRSYQVLTEQIIEATNIDHPKTYDQLVLDSKIIETRISGLEKVRNEIGNRDTRVNSQSQSGTRYRENKNSRDHERVTEQIESLYRQLGNLNADIVDMAGSGLSQKLPPNSALESRQRQLFQRFEAQGLFNRSELPNENTDIEERYRYSKNPGMYRFRHWSEEERRELAQSDRAEQETKERAEADAKRQAGYRDAARGLVTEMRVSPERVQRSAREVYYKAIFHGATGGYAEALRDEYNRQNGGTTPAARTPFLGSHVDAGRARGLMVEISRGPRVIGEASPYANINADDIINLLTYYGMGYGGGDRATTAAKPEIPVGANTSVYHEIRLGGLHRLIEEAAANAIIDGEPVKFERVRTFLTDPRVLAHLQSDIGITRSQLNSFLDAGLANIPGVGPEATTLFATLERSVKRIEDSQRSDPTAVKANLNGVNTYLNRLTEYGQLKFSGSPDSLEAQVFDERLKKLTARINQLEQGVSTPVIAVTSAPAQTTAAPRVEPKQTSTTQSTQPDAIRDVAGLTLVEIDATFNEFKRIRQMPDADARREALGGIRNKLGGLSQDQRECLLIIVESRFAFQEGGEEFASFVKDPLNTAVSLFNQTFRLNSLEADNGDNIRFASRRESLEGRVRELSSADRDSVLAIVNAQIDAIPFSSEDKVLSALTTLRNSLSRAA